MRPLLIVAMVVSLWPAGAIAAMVASGGSGTSEAPRASGTKVSEGVERIEAEGGLIAAENALIPVAEGSHELNEEFIETEIAEGVAQPEFAVRASDLAEELKGWQERYEGHASRLDLAVANVVQEQLEALGALATSPEEATRTAYEEAIEALNHVVKSAQREQPHQP